MAVRRNGSRFYLVNYPSSAKLKLLNKDFSRTLPIETRFLGHRGKGIEPFLELLPEEFYRYSFPFGKKSLRSPFVFHYLLSPMDDEQKQKYTLVLRSFSSFSIGKFFSAIYSNRTRSLSDREFLNYMNTSAAVLEKRFSPPQKSRTSPIDQSREARLARFFSDDGIAFPIPRQICSAGFQGVALQCWPVIWIFPRLSVVPLR